MAGHGTDKTWESAGRRAGEGGTRVELRLLTWWLHPTGTEGPSETATEQPPDPARGKGARQPQMAKQGHGPQVGLPGFPSLLPQPLTSCVTLTSEGNLSEPLSSPGEAREHKASASPLQLL